MLKPRKRLTRKQLKEDKLLTTIVKAQTYLENEWKRISIIAIATVIIVAVGLMIFSSNQNRENTAASRLYKLELGFFGQQIKDQQVADSLQSIVNQFKGTSSGVFATFYLANAYYDLAQYAEAEKYYNEFLDIGDAPDFMKSSAIAGIAASYEQREKYKESSDYYLLAFRNYPNTFLVPENMLGAARTLALTGEEVHTAEAIKLCEEILKKFPDTQEAHEAEILLARL